MSSSIGSFRQLVNRDGTLPRDDFDWPSVAHNVQQQQQQAVSASSSSSSLAASTSPLSLKHASTLQQPPCNTLIEVVGLDRGQLAFEGVVLNGLCSLRKIKLRNVSPSPVVVRLGSTVGDQLRWQLRNDNFAILPTELQHMTTNTVASISRLHEIPETNAMFDSVGLVSEVTLQVDEAKDIIAAFRPDASHLQPATITGDSHPVSAPIAGGTAAGNKTDSYSEQGLSSVSIAESSISSSVVGSERRAPASHNLATIDGFVNFDASPITCGEGQSRTSDGTAPSFMAVQSVSVELHATCCRSWFTIDVRGCEASSNDEVYVDLGACRIGEMQTREFEVANRSAIELFWRIDMLPSRFQIEEVESGRWITNRSVTTVSPFSHKRYRLLFRPAEPAEIEDEFVFENVADLDNTFTLHVHALVTIAPPDKTLKILSGSSLDFGDCCSGEWHQQIVCFTNVSAAPLEVSFGADKGYEITFRLDTSGADDDAQDTSFDVDRAAIGANAVDLPLAPATPDSQPPTSATAVAGAPDKPASRTIIHELARGATSYNGTRGSALLAGRSIVSQDRSPRSVQSDHTFESSDLSSEPLSTSHFSTSDKQPRTYLSTTVPARDFSRSPLSNNAIPTTQQSEPRQAADVSVGDNNTGPEAGTKNATRPQGPSTRAENSERGLFRVQDHLKLLEQRSSATVDQIYAKPGLLYRIIVSYRPSRAASVDGDGAKLVKKSFKVNISWRPWGSRGAASTVSRERKVINCKARVCTSFIAVRPATIDFGDVELGTAVQGTVSITNLSEIVARVDLRFISKVLSAYRDEIEVEVGKTVEVKLDMVPRRTNPSYQKQVSVHNLLNPDNSQVCLIKAANVDTRGVAFHSLFYRLLTPTGGNFVEFGNVPLNSRALRAITIQNTSSEALAIRLAPEQPDDYTLYLRRTEPDVCADLETPMDEPLSPNPRASAKKNNAVSSSSTKKMGDLKERVLDAIFQQPPTSSTVSASIRPDSSRVGSSQASSSTSSGGGDLAAQLREGEKGKPTQVKGNTVSFRDRALLAGADYLDLAINQPGRRGSPRGKHVGDIAKRALSRSRQNKSLLPLALTGTPLPKSPMVAHTEDPFVESSATQPSRTKLSAGPLGSTSSRDGQRAVSATSSETKPDSVEPTSASLPLTARRRMRHLSAMPKDPNKVSLEEALIALEQHFAHPDSAELNTPELEEAYVRRFVAMRRTLKGAIEEGDLTAVDKIELAPNAERTVYIILHPTSNRSSVQTSTRKNDGKISIHLERFARPSATDKDHLTGGDIPVREVVLRWTACRSQMELGMAHINFGQLEKSSSKSRALLISNVSELPLVYVVRKSGSIASGDLRLAQGRHGIISGYGKREVTIVFEPHFAGAFDETIHIDNIEDESESEAVRVRAFIVRPPTFSVSTTSLDFGECTINEPVAAQTFSITNLSNRQRTFTVRVDPSAQSGRATLEVELDPSASAAKVRGPLTTEEEEEVENVLQKLKISRRKGQADKAEKYVSRLNLLGVPVPPSDVALALEPKARDEIDPVQEGTGIVTVELDNEGGGTDTESASQSINVSEAATPASSSPTTEVGDPIPLAPPAQGSPAAETSAAIDTNTNGDDASSMTQQPRDFKDKSMVTFALEPNSRRDLTIVVVARPVKESGVPVNNEIGSTDDPPLLEHVSVSLGVSENADSKQTITCGARVRWPSS
ncbi:sphingosine N-acyltransferase lag1 [Microbotryomycetes sp. JL221]|nr:sphingosine N-acyltransferase lag1 [Microbotryomycetes sp. JL221]